ncbi:MULTISPECIES: transglycosylase domain-containing protein [unclassified Fusibacter]|uniref:transglycosylase domain-containing protein n=1 Tax=unclassified Fusibacter TaxID=2624464 RepID=UPI001011EFCF|nr:MULTISPECIES: transglycosylase domain-containing protein [unclassified Fusibacter]MCK8061274.1 transglycosylase domain-containing protein [Fusibacter sp. A2]NPE23528.1 hypothetical protein [Fusibacter sp. A1]RXV59132.1 hypothetical protein DWB64_17180 [Fusibacter sp. A1]
MGQQKKTKTKTKQKKKGRLGRILLYTFFTLFILGLIGAGAAFQIIKTIIADTEPIAEYNIEKLLEENSVIYDMNGDLIEKVQDGGVRTIIAYDEIDEDIINAFVGVEDKTFFEHSGFNYIRLVGAVFEAVTKGESPSGTSTITQQYARNMYLTDTRFTKGQAGYVRKIKEAYYTIDIEKHLSKEQILSSYLNTIELGANVQGIQAATQRYFSKDANDVDYIEAAVLAGIPKGNSKYSPFTIKRNEDVIDTDIVLGEHSEEYTIIFNEKMLIRFQTVVGVMKNNGIITQDEYDYAIEYATSHDIVERFHPGKFRNEDISSYFADMVKDDVVEALMDEKNISEDEAKRYLYGGGLKIYSTLDMSMQRTLEKAYNANDFDNKFDQATKRAVVAFQKKYDLGTDGIVGPNTLNKLAELDLIVRDEFTKDVYKDGMVDDEVLLLKYALEKDGLLFKSNENLPTIEVYRDSNRNILQLLKDDDDKVVGSKISMNDLDAIVNENEELVVQPKDFFFDDNGNLVLRKNRAFNFYSANDSDGNKIGVQILLKDAYRSDPTLERVLIGARSHYAEQVSIQELYIFKGKSVKVDYDQTSYDKSDNAVISKTFLTSNPEFYTVAPTGELLIDKTYYSIADTGIIQPQSAMVIIDYHTGELRSIIGGRNVTGQRIFNRAIQPRQPGSSMKPIGVYLPALDNGYTTSTVFDDVPRYDNSGKLWPFNWYSSYEYSYRGIMTMREALEQSVNVIPVKILEAMGVETSIPYLKKLGISTLVESGPTNDVNLSALALGGMSVGVTPFDITSAYGAIANGGVRNETITFTKVYDKYGTLIIDNTPEQTYVVDDKVAFLMHDMMQSGATTGLAKTAALRPGNLGIPIAGKTGTTSSKHDAWFVGYTPYYVAGMWIGNDVQVPLSQGSTVAAKFWSTIMKDIHSDLPDKNFKTADEMGLITMTVDNKSGKIPTPLSYADPQDGYSTIIREIFIPGTQPTEKDDVHVEVTICTDSGRLATPYCPESTHRTVVKRLRLDEGYDPYLNLEEGESPIPIMDDLYTIPRSYLTPSEDVDYSIFANDPKSPYCFIHVGVERTADTTALLLEGVNTFLREDQQRIITDSIIITTIHKQNYAVDAGSRINAQGTIVSLNNDVIYPWQIAGVALNPDGPIYQPIDTPIVPDFPGTEPIVPPLTTEPNDTNNQ